MPLIVVHLSDIHFGQEKGGALIVHNDTKERLVADVKGFVATLPGGKASGVIVTGDIAYAGKEDQYTQAAAWLNRIADAVGCKTSGIQVVPGNHDIDRDKITALTDLMLTKIRNEGEGALDNFLKAEQDRELLYSKFDAYRPFAEGYNSALDKHGGGAGIRSVELAPGRFLKFIGLNTALICSKDDAEGALLLGARQRVLPENPGEELVVLAHHPLNWLQDSDDARRYIRNRARILITGHEHNPSVKCEKVKDGCDLMMLAAGATTPPVGDETYIFTYNVLEFDWVQESEQIKVTIHPRTWSHEEKEFGQDSGQFGAASATYFLDCPNYKHPDATAKPKAADQKTPDVLELVTHIPITSEHTTLLNEAGDVDVADDYSNLLSLFFHDLSSGQRLEVLARMNAFPKNFNKSTHSVERIILDSLFRAGKHSELIEIIKDVQQSK